MMNKLFVVRSFWIYFFAVLYSFNNISATNDAIADSLFKAGKYDDAKNIFASKLKENPQDAYLNYSYGACLFYKGEYSVAWKYLDLAKHLPQANILMGDISSKKYIFDKARHFYDKAISLINPSDALYSECLFRINAVDRASRMLSAVEEVVILDSLVVGKKSFFEYYRLGNDAGRIFSVESPSDSVVVCHTGFLTQRQDRMFFSDTINGQSDIFLCNRLVGGWSVKQPLSSVINTIGEENFPFLLSDGITLYFGSDRHGSIGGYDIFVTRFDTEENDFLVPENVGMPFNSTWNDYLMAIDEEAKAGWFATDRFQANDSVIIYQFKYKEDKSFLPEKMDQVLKLEYAQLKKYHLYSDVESATTDSMILSADSLSADSLPFLNKLEQKKDMAFMITDGIVYHSLEEFKSSEARALYLKGIEWNSQRESRLKMLEWKRGEYAKTTDRIIKKRLSAEIVRLEKIISAQPTVNISFKQARNWEIKALGIKY